jgi:hypothetical protein
MGMKKKKESAGPDLSSHHHLGGGRRLIPVLGADVFMDLLTSD